MILDIFLLIIITILIILLVIEKILHYHEIKGLYSKIGIEIETDKEEFKASKAKNHIKKRMMEIANKQGGE